MEVKSLKYLSYHRTSLFFGFSSLKVPDEFQVPYIGLEYARRPDVSTENHRKSHEIESLIHMKPKEMPESMFYSTGWHPEDFFAGPLHSSRHETTANTLTALNIQRVLHASREFRLLSFQPYVPVDLQGFTSGTVTYQPRRRADHLVMLLKTSVRGCRVRAKMGKEILGSGNGIVGHRKLVRLLLKELSLQRADKGKLSNSRQKIALFLENIFLYFKLYVHNRFVFCIMCIVRMALRVHKYLYGNRLVMENDCRCLVCFIE